MQDNLATPTPTKLLTRSRLEALLLRVAPYLPLLGVLLLFVGSWMTWVTLRFVFITNGSPAGIPIEMPIMGWSGLLTLIIQTPFIRLARLTLFLWDIFPLTGILLCLILARQQRIGRRLLTMYGAWLLITTVTGALIVAHALTMSIPFPCPPGDPVCPQTHVVSHSIEVGGWLTLGSLTLGWLALALLAQRQRAFAVITAPASSVAAPTMPDIRYLPVHRLGAGVFTLGAALWAFGLLAIPWATSGCTGLRLSLNHFVRGTCSGVDGYDVLTAGLGSSGQNGILSWPLIEVAGVVGLFVVVTVWLPRLRRVTWATALLWSLLAALIFIIGVVGIQATKANPPVFTSDLHDLWTSSYGAVVCALGVLVCLAGAALLARAEIARRRGG